MSWLNWFPPLIRMNCINSYDSVQLVLSSDLNTLSLIHYSIFLLIIYAPMFFPSSPFGRWWKTLQIMFRWTLLAYPRPHTKTQVRWCSNIPSGFNYSEGLAVHNRSTLEIYYPPSTRSLVQSVYDRTFSASIRQMWSRILSSSLFKHWVVRWTK